MILDGFPPTIIISSYDFRDSDRVDRVLTCTASGFRQITPIIKDGLHFRSPWFSVNLVRGYQLSNQMLIAHPVPNILHGEIR